MSISENKITSPTRVHYLDFLSSGTFYPPPGVEWVDILLIGGGGGGGLQFYYGGYGGGGGGAGYIVRAFHISVFGPILVMVGAGGAGGADGITAGGPSVFYGSPSSFGLITAAGAQNGGTGNQHNPGYGGKGSSGGGGSSQGGRGTQSISNSQMNGLGYFDFNYCVFGATGIGEVSGFGLAGSSSAGISGGGGAGLSLFGFLKTGGDGGTNLGLDGVANTGGGGGGSGITTDAGDGGSGLVRVMWVQ
jgi:hypothetical protein